MTKTGETARTTSVAIEPESLTETWLLYQKQIIIIAIVVVAGTAGLYLWKRSGEIREVKAAQAFQSAEAAFMSGNKPLAQTELEKIVTRYKGTASGTQAAMLMAQTLFEEGKHADGVAQLEAIVGGAPKPLRAGIHALIAAGLEASGKPAEAAAAYERAAGLAQFDIDADMHRMEQARNLAASGDAAGATAIYRRIAELEDSPFAGEARVRLGEVSAKP